jgi:hypothetical protein
MPHKKKLTSNNSSISIQLIEQRIYLIRGQKVMIDFDLAELYGVPTSRLNEQVSRNRKRFPDDFMFQLGFAQRVEIPPPTVVGGFVQLLPTEPTGACFQIPPTGVGGFFKCSLIWAVSEPSTNSRWWD